MRYESGIVAITINFGKSDIKNKGKRKKVSLYGVINTEKCQRASRGIAISVM